MDKNICIVVSDNGMGHFQRQLAIANTLADSYGLSVHLFFNSLALKNQYSHKVKLFKIPVNYNKTFFINSGEINFKSEIDFRSYKLVITDNIIEITKYTSNSVLYANFLWSEVLPELKNSHSKILKNKNPVIYTNKYFSSPLINTYLNNKKIGFIVDSEDKILSDKENLLISFGSSTEILDANIKLINYIISSFKNSFNYFFIEPRYHIFFKNSQVKVATYTDKMYSTLKCALIRPGIGSITKCLFHNVKIFPIQIDDFEMKHNTDILKKIFLLVENYQTKNIKFHINHFLSSTYYQSEFLAQTDLLDFDGSKQFCKSIIK